MGRKPGPVDLFRRHIPALDGVRGFAALSVFIYHYGGGSRSSSLPVRILGAIVHFGWAGVSLFFVLSGFLISGILWDSFQKPNWWKRFYARRSLRIFPLYYLALLITLLVGLFFGSPLRSFVPLWVIALYLDNIPPLRWPPTDASGMHLEHFWSLAVEEQFYIFWPFLLSLCASSRKHAKRLILTCWVVSLIFRFAILGLHLTPEWSAVFLLGRAGELLAGAYIAMLVRGQDSERAQLFRWSPVIFWIALPALIAIMLIDASPDLGAPLMSTIGLSIASLFFASLVAMALRPGWVQSFFQTPALRFLGNISYGIYVYHLLFKNGYSWITNYIAVRIGGLGPSAIQVLLFFVALLGTLLISTISFYTYEKLFLRWKDRVAH